MGLCPSHSHCNTRNEWSEKAARVDNPEPEDLPHRIAVFALAHRVSAGKIERPQRLSSSVRVLCEGTNTGHLPRVQVEEVDEDHSGRRVRHDAFLHFA